MTIIAMLRLWWDGPLPQAGDMMQTSTGRRYLIHTVGARGPTAIGITLAKAAPQVPVQLAPLMPFLVRIDQQVLQVRPVRWEMRHDLAPRYSMDAWPTYAVGETTISLELVVDHRFEETKERT